MFRPQALSGVYNTGGTKVPPVCRVYLESLVMYFRGLAVRVVDQTTRHIGHVHRNREIRVRIAFEVDMPVEIEHVTTAWNVVEEIRHYHPGAETSPTQEKFVQSKGNAGRGLMARFTYRSRTHFGNETVESLAYLFACGDWFVKYRFTYPRAQKDLVVGVVDALLEKLKWPTDKQPKGGR